MLPLLLTFSGYWGRVAESENHRGMSPEVQSRLVHAFRVWLFWVVVLAAIPAFLTIHDRRVIHWLNTDSVKTTATVISYNSPLLKYSYTIGQRSYEDKVKVPTPFNPGDKFDVFVSASHPWISSIGKPPIAFEGGGYLAWFVLAVVLPFIVLLVHLREEEVASLRRPPRIVRGGEVQPPVRGK